LFTSVKREWAQRAWLIRQKYLELHFHLWKNVQNGRFE
jgi:hypothetical protein